MANNNWIGNAQPVADEWWFVPSGVDANSKYTLTINKKSIEVVAGEQDSSGTTSDLTVAGVLDRFVDKIASSDLEEWREVTAGLGAFDSSGDVSTVFSDGEVLVLTGPDDGKPIIVTGLAETTVAPVVQVTETNQGVAGSNETQSITFSSVATGGTFTLSYSGETTAAIDYDANAATVETELEALTAIGAGQVSVSGTSGNWTVEFTGTLAQTNVPKITGDGTNLTGAGQVDVATVVDGTDGSDVQSSLDFVFDMGLVGFSGELIPPFKRDLQRCLIRLPEAGTTPVHFARRLSDDSHLMTTYYPEEIASFYLSEFWGDLSHTKTFSDTWGGTTTPFAVISNVTGEYGGRVLGPYLILRVTFLDYTGDLTNSVGVSHYRVGNGYDYQPGWTLWADRETPTDAVSGGVPVDEVQQITVHKATGGTFTLTFEGQTTGNISYSATGATLATNIDTALVALSNIGVGDVTVAFDSETANTLVFTVTFGGTYAGMDVAQMTSDASSLTGALVVVVTETAMVLSENEIQTVTLLYNPVGGTFTLSYSGYTTTALAYDISAANLTTALEALTSIGAGNVVATGATPTWTVTFQGTLAATNVATMTGSGYGLTVSGSQACQLVRAYTRKYTGGTWVQSTRVFTPVSPVNPVSEGIAVGDYAYVCPDSEVGKASYTARVSARDSTTITLSADVFEGTAPADGTDNRTLFIVKAPTGPNYWGNVDNWSLGSLPADTDTLSLEQSTQAILYELNQSLITPTTVKIWSSFATTIGLGIHDDSGYYEYRPTYLRLGNNTDSNPTTYVIGDGDGGGASRLKLNSGDAQVALKIYNTATPEDHDLPAVMFQGTHASNTVEILKGSVGIAMLAGESANLATLSIGYMNDQNTDSSVIVGSGCGTITTINKDGGQLLLYAGVTTFNQYGGTTVVEAGAGGTVNLYGGTYIHKDAGNITTLNIYNALADFSQGTAAVTITNCTAYAHAKFRDPYKRVTFTNPVSKKGNWDEWDWGETCSLQRS